MLLLLVVFAFVMIFVSFPLRELTIGQWRRLITDIGLGTTDLTCSLVAVLLGSSLIAGDIERKTLYATLAKPISRASYVCGRFLGLAAVLGVLSILMIAGIEVILLLAQEPDNGPVLQNLITVFVTALALGGISTFFSSFTSTTLAATFSLVTVLIGHLTSQLIFLSDKTSFIPARLFMKASARILPDLESLNLKDAAAHVLMISLAGISVRVAYGVTYTLAALGFGIAVFQIRDLK